MSSTISKQFSRYNDGLLFPHTVGKVCSACKSQKCDKCKDGYVHLMVIGMWDEWDEDYDYICDTCEE